MREWTRDRLDKVRSEVMWSYDRAMKLRGELKILEDKSSDYYKIAPEIKQSDKAFYPNIMFFAKVNPVGTMQRLLEQGAIMNSDSEKRLECESKAKYQIRRYLNNKILKQRLKGTAEYYPELVGATRKGIPYEKRKHGILEGGVFKFEKRTGIKLERKDG